jgi:ABC-type Zn2+ transport system substrate-binding protein/surface adhesin
LEFLADPVGAMDTTEITELMDCDEIEDTQMEVDEQPDSLDPLLQAGDSRSDDDDDDEDDHDGEDNDDDEDDHDDDNDGGEGIDDENRDATNNVAGLGEDSVLDVSDDSFDGDSISPAEDGAGDETAP